MTESTSSHTHIQRNHTRIAWLTAALWTLLVFASAFWNIAQERERVYDLARAEANANLNKDLAFRLWASRQGGFYVNTAKHEPSPYLVHVPDRDLQTRNGDILTLLNPATILREIGNDYAQLYGVKARITAKSVLNPVNEPDAWERRALDALQNGATEVSDVADVDGAEYMRVLRPMTMEMHCLKCHAGSGVRAGGIAGATDVSIPLKSFILISEKSITTIQATHGGIWALGIGVVGFVTRRNRQHEVKRMATENELRKLSRAMEQSASAVMITDTRGVIQYVNPRFTEISGYGLDDIQGKTPAVLKSGETEPAVYRKLWSNLEQGLEWRGEIKNRKKNGDPIWCHESISVIKDEAGRMTHYVAVIEDATDRKLSEETIRQLAYYDPLTSLPNRRYFRETLEKAIAYCKRSHGMLALHYIDLDRFKTVNDTLGHVVGDKLLKDVAARFSLCLRECDTIARLGGDEFALITPNIRNSDDAAHVAQKIIDVFKVPFDAGDHELYVTTSVGISLYPTDASNSDDLIKNADIALYHAKETGKDMFQFYSAKINALALEHLEIESALRKAIECNELFIEYQPQLNIKAGRIYGLEALLRWRHPTMGIIPPGTFIPIAEETNQIATIGEWVLRTACKQLVAWDQEGLPELSISVNLSALQFRDKKLLSTIRAALKESGLPPSRLELEITESALVDNPEKAGDMLTSLRQLGLRVAIDDFGTGYSSLSYLKRFPINVLKIDQSFVRDITIDPDDKAISESIVSLASNMLLDVVAEGVETAEQFKILKKLGCDGIQGYWLGRPMSPEAISSFMEKAVKPDFLTRLRKTSGKATGSHAARGQTRRRKKNKE